MEPKVSRGSWYVLISIAFGVLLGLCEQSFWDGFWAGLLLFFGAFCLHILLLNLDDL